MHSRALASILAGVLLLFLRNYEKTLTKQQLKLYNIVYQKREEEINMKYRNIIANCCCR